MLWEESRRLIQALLIVGDYVLDCAVRVHQLGFTARGDTARAPLERNARQYVVAENTVAGELIGRPGDQQRERLGITAVDPGADPLDEVHHPGSGSGDAGRVGDVQASSVAVRFVH